MTTVAEYFLAQKVKKDLLSESEYLEVLAMHHAVLVAAMKTKQSSELGPVDTLSSSSGSSVKGAAVTSELMFRTLISKPLRLSTSAASGAPFLGQTRAPLRYHCQVPCGIFHDDGRISAVLEDASTIRKSVVQAQELHKSADKLQDLHQMIRWVNTKEDHATKIMTTVAEYFLAQKVKKDLLSESEYLEVLALHHAVLVAAMKTKQSSELGPVDTLDKTIQELRAVYEKNDGVASSRVLGLHIQAPLQVAPGLCDRQPGAINDGPPYLRWPPSVRFLLLRFFLLPGRITVLQLLSLPFTYH
eukprot:CAMPEP_0179225924 /NCGR_PEP_ID=MMETSP0797-20121207/8552_1 /TAXON_ID=47934 /ORGANISM="Dinophysis acuminata, Strain DAEP01" /LENGTH=300 /DNA_ID=CAMNT_0020932943 /DNA_START=13 /DNA_END=914 /DNA_ORIENTATION=-